MKVFLLASQIFCLFVWNVSGYRHLLQQNSTVIDTNRGQQPVEILVDMRLDQIIKIESEIGNGTKTLNGCECIGWSFNNISSEGCMNPNSYSRGAWCVVSRTTCKYEPYLGVMKADNQDVLFNFDICQCAPKESCELSYNSCPCATSWNYRGVDVKGCGNPDGGVGGPWCPVDMPNCKHVALVRKLEDFDGKSLGYWDYCRPGCCDNSLNTTP
eukprot:TRINITY_DN9728_c0_g1_i1.p1 TRINITY_DN9728_c0_g1~~TRINITY_DN9728_c0_g1_i1.p1  ORF type:complete len:213 (+),score=18.89 TRINITY_DN9728_c0_g1_i1:169-807(+)